MNIIFLIRFLIKLPIYLFIQIVFIIASPIFLIITLFSTPDLLCGGPDFPAPTTIKEWFRDWCGVVFCPYCVFFKQSLTF